MEHDNKAGSFGSASPMVFDVAGQFVKASNENPLSVA